MKITIEEIIKHYGTIIGFLSLIGIEIAPIKLSPLKSLGNLLNKGTNDRIDKIQEQVNNIEYNEDMKDLRTVKNRIHAYGMMIRKQEKLPLDVLKSVIDDLDVYEYYKEKYKYMYINGVKVKINGEIEADKKLIMEQYNEIKKQ